MLLVRIRTRRHRWTGRFEAHLWDKGTWNPTQKKKGKQGTYTYVYVDIEHEQAVYVYIFVCTVYDTYVRTYTMNAEQQFTLERTTRKTRQQEPTIWQRSSTGDLAPTPTFRYVVYSYSYIWCGSEYIKRFLFDEIRSSRVVRKEKLRYQYTYIRM